MPIPIRHLFLAVLLLILAAGPIVGAGRAATPAAAATDPAGRVVDLVNAERAGAGLRPLGANGALMQDAQAYSHVLVSGSCFSHTCGPVPDFRDRAAQAGYADWTAIGENIAAGQPSPEDVVANWLASPGHRANILNGAFTEIGVGMATGGQYGTYWVQVFGARPIPNLPFRTLVPTVRRG